MEVKGRVAMITGGASGIGRASALMLADHGVDIVILDMNEEVARECAGLIEQRGRKALIALTDVTQKAQVHEAARRAMSEFGRIDILVNSAGIARSGTIVDMPEEDWDIVVATHLKGTFLCTQAALPSMIENRWGRVVNIVSRAGFKGRAGTGPYAAAKGGMVSLARVLSRENGQYGITFNNVAPGTTDTPMVRRGRMATEEGRATEAAETDILIHPQRLAYPEEMAGAVLYFCSTLADQITGVTMHVNGGSYMP